MTPIAWSHSSLSAFETCPKRYYETKVTKAVKEPQTEATLWGNQVHKDLEKRLKGEAPLPDYMKAYEPIVAKIQAQHGQRLIEKKLAINRSFAPCGWFDKTVWCRGIVDVGVVGTESAILLDWKTGKRKVDADQLKLFAALAFAHYPFLKTITTGFVWIKENKLDQETFTHKQIHDIWAEYVPRTVRLEIAYAENKWLPKPSGLCDKWCPVPKGLCEFSGKK